MSASGTVAPLTHMNLTSIRRHRTQITYEIVDRLHDRHVVGVPADRIAPTVADWLAELDTASTLAEELAAAARRGDWPSAHALGDVLAVDVMVAA